MTRECGGCTACCTLTFVQELNKPEGVTCEHCSNGCLIYSGRPSACSEYKCSWLKGDMPDDQRPDKSGVMVEEYPLMVAALLLPTKKLSDLSSETLAALDVFVEQGKPVIATGQFAKLPAGMSASEAKSRMMQTIMEYRSDRSHLQH